MDSKRDKHMLAEGMIVIDDAGGLRRRSRGAAADPNMRISTNVGLDFLTRDIKIQGINMKSLDRFIVTTKNGTTYDLDPTKVRDFGVTCGGEHELIGVFGRDSFSLRVTHVMQQLSGISGGTYTMPDSGNIVSVHVNIAGSKPIDQPASVQFYWTF
jgi:hypothetical protein